RQETPAITARSVPVEPSSAASGPAAAGRCRRNRVLASASSGVSRRRCRRLGGVGDMGALLDGAADLEACSLLPVRGRAGAGCAWRRHLSGYLAVREFGSLLLFQSARRVTAFFRGRAAATARSQLLPCWLLCPLHSSTSPSSCLMRRSTRDLAWRIA